MKVVMILYYNQMPYRSIQNTYDEYRNGDEESKNLIIVTGIGKITAEPDTALITTGVTIEDKDVKEAQRKNKEIVSNIINELKKLGIEDDDIKTTSYTVYPQYDYIDGKKVFRGYEVQYMMQITVKDIEMVGKIIEVTIENGANTQRGIKFTVNDPKIYYDDALELAVVDGNKKAKLIAHMFASQISKVPVKVTEITNQPPAVRYDNRVAINGTVELKAGLIEIIARVEEIFEILQ